MGSIFVIQTTGSKRMVTYSALDSSSKDKGLRMHWYWQCPQKILANKHTYVNPIWEPSDLKVNTTLTQLSEQEKKKLYEGQQVTYSDFDQLELPIMINDTFDLKGLTVRPAPWISFEKLEKYGPQIWERQLKWNVHTYGRYVRLHQFSKS